MPARPTMPSSTSSCVSPEIARAARRRGLPAGTTLDELLAHERSSAALAALDEAFDEMARRRQSDRADRVLAVVRRAVGRVAEAMRPVLDWFGLV